MVTKEREEKIATYSRVISLVDMLYHILRQQPTIYILLAVILRRIFSTIRKKDKTLVYYKKVTKWTGLIASRM